MVQGGHRCELGSRERSEGGRSRSEAGGGCAQEDGFRAKFASELRFGFPGGRRMGIVKNLIKTSS